MVTRGEAQAALDSFTDESADMTVAAYVEDGANKLAKLFAQGLIPMFALLEVLSGVEGQDEKALVLAQGLSELADITQKLGELAIGTAVELGGDDVLVSVSPSWAEYLADQQALVDALPESDEETEAILADADAMAAIEEAEAEFDIEQDDREEASN